MRNKLPIALSLAALVVALLGAVPVAQSHGVFHAIFAHRAGAVDGKSAVGPGATLNRAAGKLVATKARGTDRGKFLKKFIPKVDSAFTADNATNSGALDGLDSTQVTTILRAQEDGTPGGTALVGSLPIQVNSVSITAPVNGFLVISGHAFVNNNDASVIPYVLVPKVDGTSVSAPGWGSTFGAAVEAAGAAETFELSYTVTHAVNAGAHTVTQELGDFGGGAADFFYNNNELTVLFVPGNLGAISTARPAAGASTAGRMGG